MKSIFYIFCCVASTVAACLGKKCPLAEKLAREALGYQFRCDYHYEASVEGWLKFHEVPASWHDARLMCHLEGTTLASPLNYPLRVAIQVTAGQFGLVPKDIFTGIHATFSKGNYFSVEGVPLSQTVDIWAPGEPDNQDDNESCLIMKPDGTLADEDCDVPRPYVCYKTNDDVDEINECGTVDNGYVFSKVTGSCYKFHRVPRPWSRAHMACAAEGGYLAIINSDAEAVVLRKIFAENPPSSMVGAFWKNAAFIGFHDWGEHGEFLTINGQTLAEAGYDKFAPGEPNNSTRGEFCGSIYRTGLLNDLQCENHYAFICEKNPASLLCDEETRKK